MLELWTHVALTGDEIRQVHPAEAGSSWSMNLAGTGQCSFVFVVTDAVTGMTRSEVEETFAPNRTLISLRWGGVVVGAWKIEDWVYDDDAGTVTVTGVELRNEASWRMTYSLAGYELGTLEVWNLSHAGAVRAILHRFMQWAPEWHYPIDLPPDGVGTFSQTWHFWKKFTIADLLAQIEDEGYEVVFRPYLTAGRQLRFETLVAPRVVAGSSHFHLQSADSPLSGIRYKLSGAEQLTGLQGIGSGSGQDQPVKYAGGGPFPIPIRDAKREFPDLEGDRLQAATSSEFQSLRDPIAQWTVESFTSSDEYPAWHACVARGWVLESSGHRIFPDGPHGLRVIAASGSFGARISTEVQRGVA